MPYKPLGSTSNPCLILKGWLHDVIQQSLVLPMGTFLLKQKQPMIILSTPAGSSYNADLLTAGFETLAKLRDELWPGVADEMPLGIGAGGQQVAQINMG